MAKQRASSEAKKATSRVRTPSELRAEISRLDLELVKTLNLRARLALQLSKAKAPGEPGASEPGVDRKSLEKLIAANKGPLSDESLAALFRELFSGSDALACSLRVAFLGPQYSYSHLATLSRFGSSIEPLPVSTIAAVFEEVNRGHADYGLVPVENSTDGRIADTLDMFTRLRVRICGEVPLRIHHSLLGKCPRSEIAEVYSRPQALSQCRNWLSKHLPNARPIEVTSTSTAAKLALEKPGVAAIASVQAGVFYDLNVLAENIEDNEANITRFAVIGHESAARTGNDKMSAMFEVEHRPGALADAMAIFKRNRLNLTWIESFPIPGSQRGYLFFIELAGHEHDLKVRRAMAALEKKSVRLEILGSYPSSEPVG